MMITAYIVYVYSYTKSCVFVLRVSMCVLLHNSFNESNTMMWWIFITKRFNPCYRCGMQIIILSLKFVTNIKSIKKILSFHLLFKYSFTYINNNLTVFLPTTCHLYSLTILILCELFHCWHFELLVHIV
jgi:hypothetical protein